VRIPRPETIASVQPTYYPQNINATSFQPVYQAADGSAVAVPQKAEKVKAAKKPGTGRNVFLMFASLIFVALSIVAYLIMNAKIEVPSDGYEWLYPIILFDGITPWQELITNFAEFSAEFTAERISYVLVNYIVPMAIFTFSGLIFLVDFIAACVKKYSRAFNLIFALIVGGCAIFTLFIPMLSLEIKFIEYPQYVIENQFFLLLAVAILGFIEGLCSLIFLKSLKIKPARN
jgi:hypothetical protein